MNHSQQDKISEINDKVDLVLSRFDGLESAIDRSAAQAGTKAGRRAGRKSGAVSGGVAGALVTACIAFIRYKYNI
jgi:tetrahydromethanopterin S-methyltransferase subunit G